MKILHITSHMGDGGGKAIGGLARLTLEQGDEQRILLLQEPEKWNHIRKCQEAGIRIDGFHEAELDIAWADLVVVSWWGGCAMDSFLGSFPPVPCRALLWSHKNGYYDPPLSEALADSFDGLLVTSPKTLRKWRDAVLVYGFGDYDPFFFSPKDNYELSGERMTVGYVSMPGYKRFPRNATDYYQAAAEAVPQIEFVFYGEADAEFVRDMEAAGLSKYARFCGWSMDAALHLPEFDVFGYLLKPDTSATTENSVIEAMATALPIVMSKEPIGDYVLGEKNGKLVRTPQEFAQALKDYAESMESRKLFGKRAREAAIKMYDRDENVCRFRKKCQELMRIEKRTHQIRLK